MTTTTSDPELRDAGSADLAGVAHVLAEVFRHEPVAGWLVPDRQQRYHVLHDLFAELVGHVLQAGTVHVSAENSPPGRSPPPARTRIGSDCWRRRSVRITRAARTIILAGSACTRCAGPGASAARSSATSTGSSTRLGSPPTW